MRNFFVNTVAKAYEEVPNKTAICPYINIEFKSTISELFKPINNMRPKKPNVMPNILTEVISSSFRRR